MGKKKEERNGQAETNEYGPVSKEEIANEMALSKFQRLVQDAKSRDADPLKYAKLNWPTRILVCLLLFLLTTGTIFTIVMHFRTKQDDVLQPEKIVQSSGQDSEALAEDTAASQGQEEKSEPSSVSDRNDTGNLNELSTVYEGREATGTYNYGEALQKSLLFYELQRSGDLPEETRCNWRGDSGLADGQDAGLDLTGGLYDAGDHVKFNLPMAYTSSTLAWSLYESRESYEESGQLIYLQDTLRWVNDYLMKCHPEKDVYYYQVGDGSADHSWWGPAEVLPMARPSYKVDRSNPGSTVSAAAAASLASASVVFAQDDPEYSALCLSHARELFAFANETRSDKGYTAAEGFYTSYSGFYDELMWAAAWLYLATGEDSYLTTARECFDGTNKDYKWMHCWDDVSLGATVLLADITKDTAYTTHAEKCLDYWTVGVNGERITYTPKGLAWLDSWGALRYSTTAAFVAAVYSDKDVCTQSKTEVYREFALNQLDYALGSTGFSYQIGFSDNYPQNPHHRTAQGSYSNNMNEPSEARHTLYGALVGGPDSNDNYTDEVSNYINNEVACDYNAGFTGALAYFYGIYGGETIVDFGAVETPAADEISIEACINTQGSDHTEVKAYVMNKSAWPARTLKNVSVRYFMDLSEIYAVGGSVQDITLTTNYSQGGNATGIYVWDEAAHIYYAEISFGETGIYPGGQDSYKKEVQFRMTSSSVWDSANDFSYTDIAATGSNQLVGATHMALYENGVLIYGSEPDGEGTDVIVTPAQNQTDTTGNGDNTANDTAQQQPGKSDSVNASEDNGLSLKVENQSASGNGSAISVFFTLKNTGNKALDLSKLKLEYYFTGDTDTGYQFWCDYAAISGEKYEAVTEAVKGEIQSLSSPKENADSKLVITCPGSRVLESGAEWVVQIRLAKEDWSNMNFANDYSAGGADKVLVYYEEKQQLGVLP